MKRKKIAFWTLIVGQILRGTFVFGQRTTETIFLDSVPNPLEKSGWELVFNDEFDGDTLNTSKWWAQSGIHNDEAQFYTPRHDNVFLKNGMLYLRAIRENFKDSLPYTSGEIFSSIEFGKGHYCEIRCKIPSGKGLWPAFWFWRGSNENYQEIDVFEYWCADTRRFSISNHYLKYPGTLKGKSEFKWIQPRNADGEKMDMSGKFITYAAYWDDDGIRVLVNNRLVLHFKKHIPSNPFPLILNLAVEGGRGRQPDSKTVFPADFIIDYVRVYRRK